MTQTVQPPRNVSASATERAEHMLTNAGERLGALAGKVMLRFQRTTSPGQEEAKQRSISGGGADTQDRLQNHEPATTRAEEMLTNAGQHITQWAQGGNFQVQRAIARMREGVEDMWVEAQHLHHEWHDRPR